jgi:hypothetical protein
MTKKIGISAVTLVSAAAFAGGGQYTATLASPVSATTAIVANGNIWRCEAANCVLVSTPKDASSVRSCHALMIRVGILTTYGTKVESFDSEKLAACNK